MIDFYGLHFSDNGMLEYAINDGRKVFCNSPLWGLVCNNTKYDINSMKAFSCNKRGKYIDLVWEDEEIRVIVTVCFNGRYEFNISVVSQKQEIDNVKFPIINDVNSVANSNENSYMLFPYQNGWLIKNPISTILKYKGDTPFWLGRGKGYYENEYPASYSFQFFSYYDEEAFGCYLSTEDSEAYIKTFGIYDDGNNGLRFAVTNYPENMGITKEYQQPYNFVLCFFKGDWQDGAQIYRNWAVKQKWIRGKLKDIGVNKKIENTDLWRINHTKYALGTRTKEYLETALETKKRTNANISLHWYGWNMGEHDVNYPEYISRERIKDGWDTALTKWVCKFKENGFNLIPYVNARLWDCKADLWKEAGAEKSALKDRDGNLLYEPWKEDRLKPMCPSTPLWNKTVTGFSKYINDNLFDGLYIDQVGSYNAALCFDKTHQHPIGGGTWWKNNYKHIIEILRKKSRDNSFFTTESCCEAYMDIFDLFLVLDTTVAPYFAFKCMDNYNAEPVPLFSVIYGDYGQLYGSNARFSDKIEIFEFNFIRNILWGLMPTVEGIDADELKNSRKYFDIINKGLEFYKANRDILLYGHIKRIKKPDCADIILDFGEIKLTYGSVAAVLWEYEGAESLFAYNFSDQEQKIYDTVMPGHSFEKIL